MKKIHIYTITSLLHDVESIENVSKEFLQSLGIGYDMEGEIYTGYGSHTLDVIYVRTGGTEGKFKKLLPELQAQSDRPFYLLTSGKNNSLAASMEILSFLRQNHIHGEILHGDPEYVGRRMEMLAAAYEAKDKLRNFKLAVIGAPSDWLIASEADRDVIHRQLGIELIDIPFEELLATIKQTPETFAIETSNVEISQKALPGANSIYKALKSLLEKYGLQGYTLRCFDLLSTVQNTGCLAAAKLNAEGYVAGCEGDIPSMITMAITRTLTNMSGFLANPANINPESGEMLFAHCTIPFDMVERYELDTHYESGLGVGVRGFMKEGPVTIFKIGGDLKRNFVAEGRLLMSLALPNLCRTQQVILLKDKSQAQYFLTHPIGNHHLIMPGRKRTLLEQALNILLQH